MNYNQDMVEIRKNLLKKIYDPKNQYSFSPNINSNYVAKNFDKTMSSFNDQFEIKAKNLDKIKTQKLNKSQAKKLGKS